MIEGDEHSIWIELSIFDFIWVNSLIQVDAIDSTKNSIVKAVIPVECLHLINLKFKKDESKIFGNIFFIFKY